MSMAVDDGIWIGIGATVVVVVAGVITYKVVKKRKAKKLKASVKAEAAAAIKKTTVATVPAKIKKTVTKKTVADVKKKVAAETIEAGTETVGDEPAVAPATA